MSHVIDCSECKRECFSQIEREVRLCNRCADRMCECDQERREFEYYHPSGDEES